MVMATTFRNQVASINAAASYFVQFGYHVTVSFGSDNSSAVCTIFFHDIENKEQILSGLKSFFDEGDSIDFRVFKDCESKDFFTYELSKRNNL